MKKLNWILAGLVLGTGFGCAIPKTLVLSAPAVSMTDSSFDKSAKFSSSGDVTSNFCTGDDAMTVAKGELNIGYLDELIYRAQKDSGAKYISNAQFFVQGNCMSLQGTAMK